MKEPDEIRPLPELIELLQHEKQQLIALISHDLRSPFNRLHALLQLLQTGKNALDEEQQMYLEKMQLVVADALAMMRNLMDYRSLELNLVTVQMQPVALRELLLRVVKAHVQNAQRKSVKLVMHPIPGVVVQADPYCLARALENLISNAIKFSFEGKKVSIDAGESENCVWIEVHDEGQGLKPDELLLAGRKFTKLSARPTGGESSTGLGLYIAQAMLTLTGGRLTVQSEPGKGSTFGMVFENHPHKHHDVN
ncbi:MAG: hypothetical protein KatS3mg032_1531 [Cyclobacteriaceae bacterium]|nr:MAG: hypothetical protein KatS3mg032_1531 [Cyclobacteriaceae bacterium]